MPSSQLKRAERAIEAIRNQSELPPEAADALQELVAVVRAIESRLTVLEDIQAMKPSQQSRGYAAAPRRQTLAPGLSPSSFVLIASSINVRA
jgi:uncharacterized membrane protein YccC